MIKCALGMIYGLQPVPPVFKTFALNTYGKFLHRKRHQQNIEIKKIEKRSFGNQAVLALQRFAHPKNIVLVAFFWVHK